MAKKKAKSEEQEIVNETIENTPDQEVEEKEQDKVEDQEQQTTEVDNKDAKIEELEATIKELNDKQLRLYSEFDNFRKRTMKEKLEFSKNASEKMIVSLLPVWDDFERAQKAYEESNNLESLKEGMDLIATKFFNILKNEGLSEIESNDTEFNTDEHEAITRIPAPTEEMKGKVIDTTQKGYKLNEKVIRYAQVVVGS
jgi:molecular chaperone GrpE